MIKSRDVSPNRDDSDNKKNQDIQNKNLKPLQAGRNITEGSGNIFLPSAPGSSMEAFKNALDRYQSGETISTPCQIKEDPLARSVMQEMVDILPLTLDDNSNNSNDQKAGPVQRLKYMYESINETIDRLESSMKGLSLNEKQITTGTTNQGSTFHILADSHNNQQPLADSTTGIKDKKNNEENRKAVRDELRNKHGIYPSKPLTIIGNNGATKRYTVNELIQNDFTVQRIVDLNKAQNQLNKKLQNNNK